MRKVMFTGAGVLCVLGGTLAAVALAGGSASSAETTTTTTVPTTTTTPMPPGTSSISLTIDGIQGGDPKKHEIEVNSFSWGISREATSSGGGGGTGKVTFGDLDVTKAVDIASPILMQRCAAGTHITGVDLVVRRSAGDKPFIEYALSDVFVSSVSHHGSSGDGTPTETVSFSYGKIVMTYTARNGEVVKGTATK